MKITMSVYRRKWKVKKADGRIVRKTAANYRIEYSVNRGKKVRINSYADKGAAEDQAAAIRRSLERGEQGLVDPYAEHQERSYAESVKQYVADIRTQGRSTKYCDNQQSRLNKMVEECGWCCLKDITAASFIEWRTKRMKMRRKRSGQTGTDTAAETVNQYLDTQRAFNNWCFIQGWMKGNRLGGGKVMALALADVVKVKDKPKRKRRALSEDELNAILRICGDRGIFYRTGAAIGLRRSELERLQWGDVRSDQNGPCVQLRAEATKGNRADRVPMVETLYVDLIAMRGSAKDNDPVFRKKPSIKKWKRDLEVAGIPYMDDMGRQADFHAGTRYSLNARLANANVPLIVAMKIIRHTDSKLTAVTYADHSQINSIVLPEPMCVRMRVRNEQTGEEARGHGESDKNQVIQNPIKVQDLESHQETGEDKGENSPIATLFINIRA